MQYVTFKILNRWKDIQRGMISCVLATCVLSGSMAVAAPAGTYSEDTVQELEALITKNYKGRARKLALKRLDDMLTDDTPEKERLAKIKAYRKHLLKRLNDREQPVGGESDSDGDGYHNLDDENPLLADPGEFLWKLLKVTITATPEKGEPLTFRFVDPLFRPGLMQKKNLHPLNLLGLNEPGAPHRQNLNLEADSTLVWNEANRQQINRLRAWLNHGGDANAMLAIDVMFFNHSDHDAFKMTTGSLTVFWNEVEVASAKCVEVGDTLVIPARTSHGMLVRFAAPLTKDALDIMVSKDYHAEPGISLLSGKIEVISETTGRDALERYREITKKTGRITIQTADGHIRWRVARGHDGARLTVAEALAAINKKTREFNGRLAFNYSDHGLTFIAGKAQNVDQAWICYVDDKPVGNTTALTLFMPRSLRFVLVEKKQILEDFVEVQRRRLSGDPIKPFIDRMGQYRLDVWNTGSDAGWPEALYLTGLCVAEGACGPKDPKKSAALHRLAAERGLGAAMNRLGEMYQIGSGVSMDDEMAVDWFEKAVAKSDPSGMDNLARCYYYGLGVPKEMSLAAELFAGAAKRGHVFAMASMANLHMRGIGVPRDFKQAFQLFKQAADQGHAPAMIQLAVLYRLGRGVDRDLNQSLSWLRKAVANGQDAALILLAQAYEQGWSGAKDLKQALAYYKKAYDSGKTEVAAKLGLFYLNGWGCEKNSDKAHMYLLKGAEQGNLDSLIALADLYLTGDGVEKNTDLGISYLEKAAEGGYSEAWLRLGNVYEFGNGVDADPGKALAYYKKAAEAGNSEGLAKVGWMHETGQGVQKDYQKALNYYRQAADKGSVLAQSYLAIAYQFGRGVEKDMKKAVGWLQMAAAQGDAKSMHSLAVCYHEGTGIDKDMAKAEALYRQSAELGYDKAQVVLGMLYHKGEFLDRTPEKAVYWWEKAAAQQNINAIIYLALLYEQGVGVEKDLNKAKHWFKKAAELGNSQGKAGLKRLESLTKPETEN